MTPALYKNGFVFAVIVLFIGVNIVPNISGDIRNVNIVNDFEQTNFDTLSFYPTDDSYVSSRRPSQNAGYLITLAIKNGGSDNNWAAQPVIKFDISSISSKTDMKSATLNIFYRDYHDNDPSGRELTIYRLKGDWNEDTITWDNMPVHHNEITSSIYTPNSPGNWMQWDVTGDVQDFITGQTENYGWIIKDEQYWDGANIPGMYCNSKEHDDNAPYLEIEILELKTVFIFGRIINLDATGDFITCNAVNTRWIQFSPFGIIPYTSDEKITISKGYMGVLNPNFIFGIFKATV